MSNEFTDRADLDRLLHLLYLLQPLDDVEFWECVAARSMKPEVKAIKNEQAKDEGRYVATLDHGYVRGKLAAGIKDTVVPGSIERSDAAFLAKYVLMFFGRRPDLGSDDDLAEVITHTERMGNAAEGAAYEWLRDVREAAWNVYRECESPYNAAGTRDMYSFDRIRPS
ncbi:hypothetical protein MWG58_31205 (plasmid) [Streptomyces sp. WAC00276]|uniref:hypothetical protein n=1 Tax=Streptomyces sp. WAC00276 TaxID=2933778 RepID=UPI001FFF569A|nr:hypothetical protein [Streptomyces sp. WAC00276]MCK2145294.1 hypothetical protein [Streptomyces sp. WAC00276]